MRDGRFVSVIMCFLDAEQFIEEAIESVFAQEHPDWELVLVDDGSTDRSSAIARRYERRHPDRVRYLEHAGHRNLGKSASRNAGLAASKGPLVMFFDSDDVLMPTALRTLAGAISRKPGAGVVYGRTRTWVSWPGNPEDRDAAWDFDSRLPGREGAVFPAGRLLPMLAREDDLLPSVCSAMVRREALERVGGWEGSFEDVYDDFVLWTKLFATYPVLVVDEVLSLYRRHAGSSCEQATLRGEWSPVDLNAARFRYLAWMERWLTMRRLGDDETWREVEAGLRPYRHPTAPVQIDSVRIAPASPAVRANVEHPVGGGRVRSHRVPIQGWVAGLEQRALAVEIEDGGRAIRHIPIAAHRPDVAAALERGVEAEHGFGTNVTLTGTAPVALGVTAVLEDQRRVPLASISARRVLRPQDQQLGSPLVSAIVVCRTEVGPLAATIESALAQLHRPLEVVVVDDGSSSAVDEIALLYPGVRYVRAEGEGTAAARRLGLRRCSGEFVLFLAPGTALYPGAVGAALSRLRRHRECGFVVGSGADRPLDHAAVLHDGAAAGPTLYRRSALSALAQLPEAAAGLEDAALQLAVARDTPGLAIADPMAVPGPARPTPSFEAQLDLLRTQRSYAQGPREVLGLEGGERRVRAAIGKRRRRDRRGEGSAVVLLYHRIAELDSDPWQLGVGREHFAQQLAVLRERFEVVPLTELVSRIDKGGLPRRGVAVSFDDGYSDNLEAALPELEAAGVPATLYLAQGVLDSPRELWWDELERILLAPRALPQKLVLAAGSWRFAYDLGDAATLSPAAARAAFGWHVGSAPPTRRHGAFAALWESLWPLDESTRTTAMEQLRGWSGDPDGVRETHRTLRLEDVAELAQGETFELGGHTITHPRLSARGWAEQRDEIATGKTRLEELIGRPLRSFAYPYGGLDDFTAATVDLVAEAGFTSACATWEGVVNAASDPWRVPRFQVPDVDGDAFGEWLEAKFDGGR